jgi:hypothetical protein
MACRFQAQHCHGSSGAPELELQFRNHVSYRVWCKPYLLLPNIPVRQPIAYNTNIFHVLESLKQATVIGVKIRTWLVKYAN